jgi:hypothetical protein
MATWVPAFGAPSTASLGSHHTESHEPFSYSSVPNERAVAASILHV